MLEIYKNTQWVIPLLFLNPVSHFCDVKNFEESIQIYEIINIDKFPRVEKLVN